MTDFKDATDAQSTPSFRLAKVLEQRLKEERSYVQLAKRITEANKSQEPSDGGKDVIDRRRLQKIVEADVSSEKRFLFGLDDLIYLNRYLEQFNMGLTQFPILDQPFALQGLAEMQDVAFLLGTRRYGNELTHSRWDVKSIADLQKILSESTGHVRTVIREVYMHETAAAVRKSNREPWAKEFLESDTVSIVCIGSPKSCLAAEWMLAIMFGVRPFRQLPYNNPKLPFHFVWAEDDEGHTQSSFALSLDELEDVAPRFCHELRSTKCPGVECEEHFLAAPLSGDPGRAYGFIAAQYRPNGTLWIVVAGLTGPGTLAAAEALPRLLAPQKPNGKLSVTWAMVSADVTETTKGAQGVVRRIARTRFENGPNIWYPEA